MKWRFHLTSQWKPRVMIYGNFQVSGFRFSHCIFEHRYLFNLKSIRRIYQELESRCFFFSLSRVELVDGTRLPRTLTNPQPCVMSTNDRKYSYFLKLNFRIDSAATRIPLLNFIQSALCRFIPSMRTHLHLTL